VNPLDDNRQWPILGEPFSAWPFESANARVGAGAGQRKRPDRLSAPRRMDLRGGRKNRLSTRCESDSRACHAPSVAGSHRSGGVISRAPNPVACRPSLKVLTDLFEPATDHELIGWLFIKGLGAGVRRGVHVARATDRRYLAGPERHPAVFNACWMALFAELGYRALLRLPTLFWLNSSSAAAAGAPRTAGRGRPRCC